MPAKKIWVEVDQKGFERGLAITEGRDLYLFETDSPLNDVGRTKSDLNRVIPIGFGGFPTDENSVAAVVVVGLQDKAVALFADEINQIYRLAEVVSRFVPHHESPWNMPGNDLELVTVK